MLSDRQNLKTKAMTTYEQIKQIVCIGEGIPLDSMALSSKSRKRELVFARQVIIFFMKELTKESLAKIGSYLGKDHATVIHSCRTINDLVETDKSIRMKIHLYREKIKLLMEFTYDDSLRSVKTIRTNIEYCVSNNIEIPEDMVRLYNTLIKGSKIVDSDVDN